MEKRHRPVGGLAPPDWLLAVACVVVLFVFTATIAVISAHVTRALLNGWQEPPPLHVLIPRAETSSSAPLAAEASGPHLRKRHRRVLEPIAVPIVLPSAPAITTTPGITPPTLPPPAPSRSPVIIPSPTPSPIPSTPLPSPTQTLPSPSPTHSDHGHHHGHPAKRHHHGKHHANIRSVYLHPPSFLGILKGRGRGARNGLRT